MSGNQHVQVLIFLLPLHSGGEVWEGIRNQTKFNSSGIEFLSLKKLHHVTLSHDKAHFNDTSNIYILMTNVLMTRTINKQRATC